MIWFDGVVSAGGRVGRVQVLWPRVCAVIYSSEWQTPRAPTSVHPDAFERSNLRRRPFVVSRETYRLSAPLHALAFDWIRVRTPPPATTADPRSPPYFSIKGITQSSVSSFFSRPTHPIVFELNSDISEFWYLTGLFDLYSIVFLSLFHRFWNAQFHARSTVTGTPFDQHPRTKIFTQNRRISQKKLPVTIELIILYYTCKNRVKASSGASFRWLIDVCVFCSEHGEELFVFFVNAVSLFNAVLDITLI